jgi:phosphonate degradation associated HDIG domain protein
MSLSIPEIVALYRTAGAARYGMEAISQEQHALQCAVLSERAGSPPELVAAALLHDLGHLVATEPAAGAAARDDLHEYASIPFLRGTFTEAVIQPIRLHVDAKRYLCAVSSGYRDALSPASQRSLALQGGPFAPDQAQAFIRQPFAGQAVALRRWDDCAKDPLASTPGWSHFGQVLLRASAGRHAPSAAA